ncbi:MAG: nucleotidyltransferase [Lachnospiraceae bacterium]|nr:nucleotidyltransferase [Lachnospiraceae bacterium]
MTVNGIIAEYNPFHNGHVFHIEKSKALTGADATVVVMSGNFVQRGAPAVVDKFVRTKMALENGADLVLELPSCYSTASAEYFANAGVALLDKLGIIDYLSFGSESGDIKILEHIAGILLEEPKEFSEYMQRYLREGYTYPLARNNALIQYETSLFDVSRVLESPNNILGIEYIKAIKRRSSSIRAITISRNGSNYHDRYTADSSLKASAQAIREAIPAGGDFSPVMPESAYTDLFDEITNGSIMDVDDFSSMLYYKLLSEKNIGYTSYFDVSQALSDRIVNALPSFTSFKNFIEEVKSRDRTYTRISRCLLHILLDITERDMESYKLIDYIPYARVLGFKRGSEELLSEIKCHSSIPLITKIADASGILYSEPWKMFRNEIRAGEIYYAARAVKTMTPAKNEFSTPLVIL